MKTLAVSFSKLGWDYKQRVREGDLCVYERSKPGYQAPPHFEVIRVHNHNGRTFPNGKTAPPAEYYPSTAEWGDHGFTCPTLDVALTRLKKMSQPTPKRANRADVQR